MRSIRNINNKKLTPTYKSRKAFATDYYRKKKEVNKFILLLLHYYKKKIVFLKKIKNISIKNVT